MIPYRSENHRAFVRSLRCCACGKRWNIEAAHTGPHGLSQKASDRICVPLCRTDHMLMHKIGQVRFEAMYSIDLRAIAERLSARPYIHLVGTAWVGEFENESYVLVPRASGLVAAIRKMGALRREALEQSLGRSR